MKHMVLPALLLLAACSKPTQPADPQSAAAPPQPAPAYDPWPGKYEGELMVRISPVHRITLITANAGCTGDAGLAGGEQAQQIAPDHLRLVLTARDASASGAACTVDLTQKGDRVTAVESGDCSAWHGAACAFNGTAARVKSSSP